MTKLDRKLMRDIVHLRGQLIAVALVVLCGVATFISMGSTYYSLLTSQKNYYDQYRFANVFAQLKRAPESVATQLRSIPGVSQLQTRIVMEVTLDIIGMDEPATARLVSIPDEAKPTLNSLYLRTGRYIEPNHPDEVIVSEAFAAAHQLKLSDSVKAIINGRLQLLHIVGIALSPEYIYEVRGGGSFFPDNKRFGVFWIGQNALARAFNMEGEFNDVIATLTPEGSEAEVISNIDKILATYGGLSAYGRSEQTSNQFISDEIEQNRFSSTVIPLIFLGVATFLLYIVLSRLVNLERNQIAILKAFGYTNWSINIHYLKLALVPVWGGVALGTVVGMYLGIKLTTLYTFYYHFPILKYEPSPQLIAFAVLTSMITAAFSVVTALQNVIAIAPAEAMRPEPPAQFRAGLLEKLKLHKLFSPAIRMIIRNIERRPLKALFSILGVAVSVAILIIGQYFFDAFDHMLFVQYEKVQRQNVTVIFNEVRSSRVRYELERLPGVLRCEPFRAVAVRLKSSHFTKRVGLLGLEPDSQLHCLVDKKLNSWPLPPEGMVLTKKLAEILSVKPGDLLIVEVLEGARPIREVKVAGLVDELIGLSAYMDVNALMRLLQQEQAFSGAYLRVDPLFTDQLYKALKQMPAVGGVSSRDVEISSIRETIKQSMDLSTGMLIVFASIIAFGIVYNGSRIALSERGREIASLRILGFRQSEVSFMLLGEQALLTFIGIPIGFLLGFAVCAWIPYRLNTELYRLTLVVNFSTYLFAFLVIAIAAFLSGLFVRWRIVKLDLIAVLKTRE